MERLLNTLALIEKGEADQHEASVLVGKLLKEIYIDSALAKSKKIDDINEVTYKEPIKISYKEYKNNQTK
jgi:polyhydroxyalkanoate synthesis regulator phasin